MEKAAIIPASGIGDALMMMIAAEACVRKGFKVTVFHDKILSLRHWFPSVEIRPFSLKALQADVIYHQNDNTNRSYNLREKRWPHLITIFPTLEPQKHNPIMPQDIIFDPKQSLCDNLASTVSTNKETGMVPPPNLIYKKYRNRLIFHPASGAAERNWPKKKYETLAKRLIKKGFEPCMCVAPHERFLFPESPLFPTYSDLAAFVYESGGLVGNDSSLGHLASLFKLPTLTISRSHKEIALWRPGFFPGEVITPPRFIPNLKGFRIREKYWKKFIQVNSVEKLINTNS
ncbi:MAG: hypothetical protein WDZ28_03530 [Simkaniaceae bacterium]